MWASKKLRQPRPRSFERYMASSACCSSSSTPEAPPPQSVAPRLAVIVYSAPLSTMVSASAFRICCPIDSTCETAASTPVATLGSNSANSSPPIRATVSPSRMQACSRCATLRSSASPMACPAASLTDLNWSKSMNTTEPIPLSARWLAARATFKRSCSRVRLGSWVNAS